MLFFSCKNHSFLVSHFLDYRFIELNIFVKINIFLVYYPPNLGIIFLIDCFTIVEPPTEPQVDPQFIWLSFYKAHINHEVGYIDSINIKGVFVYLFSSLPLTSTLDGEIPIVFYKDFNFPFSVPIIM